MITPPAGSPGPPRRTSVWHLLWGVPASLLVGMIAFVVSFFAWCGTERCAALDPGRYAIETVVALVVTAAGASLGGAILLFTPWTPRRAWRVSSAGLVAAVPVGVALWYVARFTQSG